MTYPAHFSVRLLIRHPSIDPKLVTDWLSIEPKLSWQKGQDVVTPRGQRVGGVRKHSAWSYWEDFEASDSMRPSHVVAKFVAQIEAKTVEMSRLLEQGGECILILTIYNNHFIGDQLSSLLLKRMGELGIDFGVELTLFDTEVMERSL